jgi:DtxR family Mn-dependent transcriptional regulator
MTAEDQQLEELLQKIWWLREKNISEESALDRSEFPENWLAEAEARSLIRREQGQVLLTDAGAAMAEGVVRRHRLAEVLFSQVLEVPEGEVEAQACEFEHILSPAVTDKICAFLGHPEACPHGKPIPRGKCCENYRSQVQPLISRLSRVPVGAEGVVVMISPKYHSRLDRLQALGITPGARLRLHQKKPAVIVQVDETTVALDPQIAEEIYFRVEQL